jgi:hypothetical protein
MSELPRPEAALATSEQAQALFDWVVTATEARGTHYGHCDGFGEVEIGEVPEKVSEHLPTPDPLSQSVRHTVYVTRERDHKTHEPRTQGVVANVMFDQKERVDEGLLYATHVNYHIVNDGSDNLSLERHVTNTEHGEHKAAEFRRSLGRPLTREYLEAQLQDTEKLLADVLATRPAEKAAGMFDVEFEEAQQVIETCSSL